MRAHVFSIGLYSSITHARNRTHKGRKSRRERRALKDSLHRNPTPPSYAMRDSPTYEPYKSDKRRSGCVLVCVCVCVCVCLFVCICMHVCMCVRERNLTYCNNILKHTHSVLVRVLQVPKWKENSNTLLNLVIRTSLVTPNSSQDQLPIIKNQNHIQNQPVESPKENQTIVEGNLKLPHGGECPIEIEIEIQSEIEVVEDLHIIASLHRGKGGSRIVVGIALPPQLPLVGTLEDLVIGDGHIQDPGPGRDQGGL